MILGLKIFLQVVHTQLISHHIRTNQSCSFFTIDNTEKLFFYYSVGKTCKIQALRYNRHAVNRPEPK